MHKILAQFKSNAGFTLIELIIAITIVVILTTVGIASFNSASKANATFQKAQEIQSAARKIETDATAAVKPITGSTTPTSCKSVDLNPDVGTLYGGYITFDMATNSYFYGMSCFNSDGSINLSSQSTAQTLASPMQFTYSPSGSKKIIYFSFDGGVYAYDQVGTGVPDFAFVTSPGTVGYPIVTPQRVIISYPSLANPAYLYVSGAGLVCVQKTTPTSCAN